MSRDTDPDHIDVKVFDLVEALAEAVHVVDRGAMDHHRSVAVIATAIAAEMGLSQSEQKAIHCAALVHDVAVFSLRERFDLARFDAEDVFPHCLTGYLLLRDSAALLSIAEIVRYHHTRWDGGIGSEFRGDTVPVGGHVVHLADRVSVLLDGCDEPLEVRKDVVTQIRDQSGKMFNPEVVEAFKALASKERFWFDAVSRSPRAVLKRRCNSHTGGLGNVSLTEMANLFGKIIDFRSRFTATHSTNVAAVAEKLGELLGFPWERCRMLSIAGHVHDLGKIAVPVEILEKPGALTVREYNVVKIHPYLTSRILGNIELLRDVSEWASSHHERIDGSGYPSHLRADRLSTEARILAVADTFAAMAEDRPYRRGLPGPETSRILSELAVNSKLDAHIVSVARKHLDELDGSRRAARRPAQEEYQQFATSLVFPAFREN